MPYLIFYFILTFAVAAAGWFVASLLPADPSEALARGVLFLPGTFAPAISAIALTAIERGRSGVAELVRPIGRWEVAARYYLFALLYIMAVKIVAAVVHRGWLGEWPTFGTIPIYLMMLGAIFSTPFQAGEEIGWRGYALPRLRDAMGLPIAAVVLGVIWATWHLPLFFIYGTPNFGQSFPLYLVQVTALSVAFAWLYWRTGGSLLLVMILHGAVNNTSSVVPAGRSEPGPVWSVDSPAMGWLVAGVLWVVAVVLIVQMRHDRSSGVVRERQAVDQRQ